MLCRSTSQNVTWNDCTTRRKDETLSKQVEEIELNICEVVMDSKPFFYDLLFLYDFFVKSWFFC